MKKLIVVSIVAAFFAACNNTPAVSESATKVAGLNHWVDSVKGLAAADTACNAEAWGKWDSEYQAAASSINETELAEADKTSFTAAKENWAKAGVDYTACIENKAKAAAASTMMDSTKMVTPEVVPAPAEAKKEEAKKH